MRECRPKFPQKHKHYHHSIRSHLFWQTPAYPGERSPVCLCVRLCVSVSVCVRVMYVIIYFKVFRRNRGPRRATAHKTTLCSGDAVHENSELRVRCVSFKSSECTFTGACAAQSMCTDHAEYALILYQTNPPCACYSRLAQCTGAWNIFAGLRPSHTS